MMTEEEAKKRWCPMARVHISRSLSGSEYYSNNRLALHDLTTCIASGCMAWRWELEWDWAKRIEANRELSKMSLQEVTGMTPREGYCGLAGKQEAT